eukprot:1179876-Prorocentrum_minimum.AAC.4
MVTPKNGKRRLPSFYGSSCANNGEDARDTPQANRKTTALCYVMAYVILTSDLARDEGVAAHRVRDHRRVPLLRARRRRGDRRANGDGGGGGADGRGRG